MAKALIIGAGGVASVAVHKCVQNSEVFEIVLLLLKHKRMRLKRISLTHWE